MGAAAWRGERGQPPPGDECPTSTVTLSTENGFGWKGPQRPSPSNSPRHNAVIFAELISLHKVVAEFGVALRAVAAGVRSSRRRCRRWLSSLHRCVETRLSRPRPSAAHLSPPPRSAEGRGTHRRRRPPRMGCCSPLAPPQPSFSGETSLKIKKCFLCAGE